MKLSSLKKLAEKGILERPGYDDENSIEEMEIPSTTEISQCKSFEIDKIDLIEKRNYFPQSHYVKIIDDYNENVGKVIYYKPNNFLTNFSSDPSPLLPYCKPTDYL